MTAGKQRTYTCHNNFWRNGTPQKRPSLWTRDFALVCLFNLAIFISFQMLMPTIPVYVDRLGGNQAVIGLVTGIFTVSSVALRPWTGLGLDRYGRRGIWLAGTLVFVLAVAGYNWALSIALLMMLRVVHGAGWGILTVSAATAATDLVPPPRRGEGMGFFGLGANLGMAVGLADSLAAFLGAAVVGGLGFGSLHPALQALAVATCAPTRRGA
ncbi:MAG: MFS transporter, partial [Bacillota bacterium]